MDSVTLAKYLEEYTKNATCMHQLHTLNTFKAISPLLRLINDSNLKLNHSPFYRIVA